MKSETDGMDICELGLSNFDGKAEHGLDEILRDNAAVMYAPYAGWNFHGRVWWSGLDFKCEVWRYGAPVVVMSAPSLEDIITVVSDEYGYE